MINNINENNVLGSLVPLELAKELKEHGYQTLSNRRYNILTGNIEYNCDYDNYNDITIHKNFCIAPYLFEIIDWFLAEEDILLSPEIAYPYYSIKVESFNLQFDFYYHTPYMTSIKEAYIKAIENILYTIKHQTINKY